MVRGRAHLIKPRTSRTNVLLLACGAVAIKGTDEQYGAQRRVDGHNLEEAQVKFVAHASACSWKFMQTFKILTRGKEEGKCSPTHKDWETAAGPSGGWRQISPAQREVVKFHLGWCFHFLALVGWCRSVPPSFEVVVLSSLLFLWGGAALLWSGAVQVDCEKQHHTKGEGRKPGPLPFGALPSAMSAFLSSHIELRLVFM